MDAPSLARPMMEYDLDYNILPKKESGTPDKIGHSQDDSEFGYSQGF